MDDIDNVVEYEWIDGDITDYGFNSNYSSNPTTGIFPLDIGESNNWNEQDCMQLYWNNDCKWDGLFW